jgi:hypothetical protein
MLFKECQKMNKLTLSVLLATIAVGLAGCDDDAVVASRNLSKAADNFEITRRIVFYNGFTNDYILTIEGLCSQEQTDKKLAVTCKTGANSYKKHFLGLSDNVTYFSEQMEAAPASVYHYRVTFKPATIVPSIDFRN